VLDQVLGAWLWTRAVQAGGRLVIAIDGKTVRGAKNLCWAILVRKSVWAINGVEGLA
jgi:hypothetical protein